MRYALPITVTALVAVYVWLEHARAPTCEVWQYRTRKGEEASRVYVCAVEEDERFGTIYHVYLDGLEIPNPEPTDEQDAVIRVLSHLPLTKKAFLDSVVKRVEEDAPMPAWREGYEVWKEAYAKGEAGVFEVPLRACIERIAQERK